MSNFDPAAFLASVEPKASEYDGAASAFLIEIYRNGVSAEVAHGTVSHESDTSASNDNKYQIGSQTKMMTATVLLQLASEGALSFDDKLADVMDVSGLGGIANIENATLYQLLTHSSGIADYANDTTVMQQQIWEQLQSRPVGPTEIIEMFNELEAPANFEPGTETSYSNTGFLLLGMAIEAVTGNTMAEELHTRIFEPLGMSSTSLPGSSIPEGILSSYAMISGELADVTRVPLDLGSEGGVVSTTGDMVRFMKALAIDQTLVAEDQYDALEQYFIASGFSGEFLGHTGGSLGTGSIAYVHLPTETIIVAVEPTRVPSDFFSTTMPEVMTSIILDQTWQSFQIGEKIEFVLSAAELDISEETGTDGSLDMALGMGGVSLTLDGALSDLDSSSLVFDDGSVILVADAAGERISIRSDARGSLTTDNQLIGLAGTDQLIGGRGDDKIIGGSGEDILKGRRGDDLMQGGDGDDRLSGNRGNDQIDGGTGDDLLVGGRGNDALDGGVGNDILRGGRGADQLEGGAGNDRLVGGRGNDVLFGGEGDDVLLGGKGTDTFVFAETSGVDTVIGFETGKDKIELTTLSLTFEDLTIREQRYGYAEEVSFEGGSILFLDAGSQLCADDFLF